MRAIRRWVALSAPLWLALGTGSTRADPGAAQESGRFRLASGDALGAQAREQCKGIRVFMKGCYDRGAAQGDCDSFWMELPAMPSGFSAEAAQSVCLSVCRAGIPPASPRAETVSTAVNECLAVVKATLEEESGPKSSGALETPFIKGDLTNMAGSTRLLNTYDRFGMRMGYQSSGMVRYGLLNPEVDLHLGGLRMGLGAPVAIQLSESEKEDATAEKGSSRKKGGIRLEDWDETSEYVRLIRYLRYGKKEEHFFFNLSQISSSTIGHGPLMRRYSVNIDPDSTKVSGEIDAYNDYGGFELYTNDIINWNVLGGIAFAKPLSLLSDHWMARTVSLGLTYLVDRRAPVVTRTKSDDPYYMVGTGQPSIARSALVQGLGVDLEMKVVKTAVMDIKPFVDYSWLVPDASPAADPDDPDSLAPTGGGGLTLGVLGRFNLGQRRVHAIRAIAEFRSFSAHYRPSYFDTFYEVQKFVINHDYGRYAGTTRPLPPTKFKDVFMTAADRSRYAGYYLELSYSLVDRLAATIALEGSQLDPGSHFMGHLEAPLGDFLYFFVTYHHRSLADFTQLFSPESGDQLAFAAGRLKILPWFFINGRYFYTLQLGEGMAEVGERYRYYEPNQGFQIDVEVDWDF